MAEPLHSLPNTHSRNTRQVSLPVNRDAMTNFYPAEEREGCKVIAISSSSTPRIHPRKIGDEVHIHLPKKCDKLKSEACS